MAGIELGDIVTGAPMLTEGLASLDCRVRQVIPLGKNTLFLAEVAGVQVHSAENPLVYHDRKYHHLGD